METNQLLVQPDRPRLERLVIGRDHRLPSDKIGHGRQGRRVGGDFKNILRAGRCLFTRRVELERVERDEIVQRRPMGVGSGSLFEQIVIGGDRRLLQQFGMSQRLGKLAVDLPQQTRQIPSREVFARGRFGPGTLQEPPAILLVILPEPVRENRFHDWLHLRRRLGDLGPHPRDLFLGFAAFDHPLVGDRLTDRLNGLRVAFFP